MDKLLFKDSSGKASTTVTAFWIGFGIASLKLLVSGITIKGFTVPTFTGSDYALVVGSLGTIYTMRRNFGNPDRNK